MVGRIEGQLNQLGAWSAKAHKQSTKIEGTKEYHRKKSEEDGQSSKIKTKTIRERT